MFEVVGAELGYRGKSRSAMLPLLVKKEPDAKMAAVLRRHFGDPPAEVVQELVAATETPDPLIAALTRQSVAIEALVARLDTFVGPLGDVVADLLREKVKAATDRTRSGAAAS